MSQSFLEDVGPGSIVVVLRPLNANLGVVVVDIMVTTVVVRCCVRTYLSKPGGPVRPSAASFFDEFGLVGNA